MSSLFGKMIQISIFGESHGPYIGMVIDGLKAGLEIDMYQIQEMVQKRKPIDLFSTSRHEDDEIEFISGVFQNKTTGTPLCFIIKNKNTRSEDYPFGPIRPSHVDYPAHIKYHGFEDYRGGGFFSGRLTVCLVVLGAICKQILEAKNIKIASHILEIGSLVDQKFSPKDYEYQIEKLSKKTFSVIDETIEEEMKSFLTKIHQEKDSIGAKIETIITGLPIGVGEPFFSSIESTLSSLLFSIGGVKGVLFGDGEDFVASRGSEVHDELKYQNDKITYLSNHNGGILGGLSTGEPILIQTILKPVSSIGLKQKSIDIVKKENISLEIQGRHDTCLAPRACIVIDAILYYGILDLYLQYLSRE